MRHVVVVGGAGALGAAAAVAIAEQGDRVTVADLRGATEAAASLPGDGHDGVALDVTSLDDVTALLGPEGRAGAYDAVVYAAGANYTGPVATTDWNAYQRVMDINLRGAFHVGHALARSLQESPRPAAAVFFSSTAGLVGESGASVYAASKFALIGFVQCLAAEIALDGGRANCVCPGNIDSPMLRTLAEQVALREGVSTEQKLAEFADESAFGRLISLREVAAVTAFLAGAGSSGMSGQSVVVNGAPR